MTPSPGEAPARERGIGRECPDARMGGVGA